MPGATGLRHVRGHRRPVHRRDAGSQRERERETGDRPGAADDHGQIVAHIADSCHGADRTGAGKVSARTARQSPA